MNIWAKFKTSCLKCHIFPKELFEWRLVKDANVGFKKNAKQKLLTKTTSRSYCLLNGIRFYKSTIPLIKKKKKLTSHQTAAQSMTIFGKRGQI